MARAADDRPCVVIAHRGASSERPEHTLAAYRLAIEQGADFIEPDLVPTRDGVLIARHENELSGTTDVAEHAEFGARRTKKQIDGDWIDGWFAEDLTIAEIKTLRARERIPAVRPANTCFDGQESIPTLAEIIALVREAEVGGRQVGIYPETKHPTFFDRDGRYLDGQPIHRSISAMLVADLVTNGFTDPSRVFIQSFELGNLLSLSAQTMPAANVRFPLILLMGALDFVVPHSAASQPFDFGDIGAVQTEANKKLAVALGHDTLANAGYADLGKPAALAWLKQHGISGIGPWKDSILLRRQARIKSSKDTLPAAQLTGEVHPLIGDARQAGLLVHPYTLRAELPFAVRDEQGAPLSMEDEMARLLDAGATGFFTDFPARGARLRDTRTCTQA